MESHSRATGPRGVVKRTRQACSSCRRRKTKCSGERPVCAHCQQSRVRCVYEPYTTFITTETTSAACPPGGQNRVIHDLDLLDRISSIEAVLNKLTQGGAIECQNVSRGPHPLQVSEPRTQYIRYPDGEDGSLYLDTQLVNDNVSCESDALPEVDRAHPRRSPSVSHLPPVEVIKSLVNTYFSRIQNQPYAFFHPSTFQQRLDRDSIPRCLLFAVLAMAVRFTDHSYFQGNVQEASDAYSRRSWLHVIDEYLSVDDKLDLALIQTVSLLALVDYTAGRASSGWLRLGLAVRLSQDFELIQEPPYFLSPTEKEERRRSFWSIYIIDKLMSCSRSRPPAILDQDCTLQLPCDEDAFQNDKPIKTPMLEEMQSWQSAQAASVSSFGLAVLASSIFGHCVRYVYGKRGAEAVPPWDPKSDYVANNASLLLLESLIDPRQESALDTVLQESPEAGHHTFSWILFHLSHCLLNHPFLMRLRLRTVAARMPASFVAHTLHLSRTHATQLTDLLTSAATGPAHLESSFYSYCAAVAAGIHSLAYAVGQQAICSDGGYEADSYMEKAMQALRRLAGPWPFAVRMKNKLDELAGRLSEFAYLFDPKCIADGLSMGPESEQFLWSLLDLDSLTRDGSSTGNTPASLSLFANLPSPDNWELLSVGQDSLAAPGSEGCDTMMMAMNMDQFGFTGLPK